MVDVSAVDTAKTLIDSTVAPLATGSDGTLADTDYELALEDSESELLANIVFNEYNATRNGYLKIHTANTQDRMALLGGGVSDSVTTTKAAVALLRDTDGRLVYCDNWVQTKIGGVDIYTSPTSWLASIMSQTAPNVDPAYALNTKFLAGAIRLKNNHSRNTYIELLQAGVASFETDADIGIKLKSGVTTQIANSSKLSILRRRMADFLTNSIGKFLKVISK